VGGSSVSYRYRGGTGFAQVELALQGPPLEINFLQAIPLGARNVRVEGSPDARASLAREGRHDAQYDITLRLTEDRPVLLLFHWDGGLSVSAPPSTHRPGDRSSGVRVLDFVQEGSDWVLTLEGDGGGEGLVHLRGEGVVTPEGAVLEAAPGAETFPYRVAFPDTAPRVVRTLRLSPLG
jgi:hypothetical protein